jgi:hypothetical protein
VVRYLTDTERMLVLVEGHMYEAAAEHGLDMDQLFTFTSDDSDR